MFKVYNKQAITRQERFNNALVAGIGATAVITVVYGWLSSLLQIEFSVVYLAIGYAIGWIIQKYGRGVQIQFSILAAVLATFCFLFGDMIELFGFQLFMIPEAWPFALQAVLGRLLAADIHSLLSLAFRLGGIYFAYLKARIV